MPNMELFYWTDRGWHLTNNMATPLSLYKALLVFPLLFPSLVLFNIVLSNIYAFYVKICDTVHNCYTSRVTDWAGKENKTLKRKHSESFPPTFTSPFAPHSDAREPYGDWQACYVSLSCQLASALGSFSLQWRDKSLLTCQATVNANWACYQCIIYRESGRHFHRTGS